MDLLRFLAPKRSAHAHCDIPCGVYDPEQARIEAESCHRIIERYHASDDEVFKTRCIVVKEERADLVKHHIDVLWHDYFKPEHVEKYPDLHDICWKASKQASAVKQGVDLDAAKKLLALIDQIDEMWKGTGGPGKTRMASSSASTPTDDPLGTPWAGRPDSEADDEPMLRRLTRSWRARVAVEGASHASRPSSLATGCWSTPMPTRRRLPAVGDLVLVPDPRRADAPAGQARGRGPRRRPRALRHR